MTTAPSPVGGLASQASFQTARALGASGVLPSHRNSASSMRRPGPGTGSQSVTYAGIIGQESRHVTCVKPRARTDRRGAPRSMHVHGGMVSGGPAALRRRGIRRDDMPRCSCAAQAWACRAAANRKKNDGVPVRPRLSVPLVTAACPGAHLFRCRISHWGGALLLHVAHARPSTSSRAALN